jgi:hypothetical protein
MILNVAEKSINISSSSASKAARTTTAAIPTVVLHPNPVPSIVTLLPTILSPNNAQTNTLDAIKTDEKDNMVLKVCI